MRSTLQFTLAFQELKHGMGRAIKMHDSLYIRVVSMERNQIISFPWSEALCRDYFAFAYRGIPF